jgi:DHA1 family bicyclomycin/chloramphenicol resistance-like MFS transporter
MQQIREDLQPVKLGDRRSPPHILTLILLAGMSACVMNMFLPSLPAMATHFDTDYAVMQLSVAIYLGFSAILQIFVGPISDKFGRRPVILWGLGIFMAATVGCINAPNIETFLTFRMMQAAIATSMVLSRAAVRDMYAQDQAASMIGYVTMGMAVVPMLAPALGGLLDEAFGWRGSFALMLVAGVAVLALSWRDMGETRQGSGGSFRAQFAEMPELMRSRRFWGYCATSSLASGAFFAYLGGAPFVGAQVYGMSPATLGLFFGAPALGYAAGNFASGRYAARIGIDRMILIGAVINFGGMALLSLLYFSGLHSPFVFFGCFIFVGLGNGMILPSATSGMMSVRPHLAGSASGIGGAIMIGAGAALSALAGALLTPGSGAEPLIVMLFITTALAMASILYVMARARAVGA